MTSLMPIWQQAGRLAEQVTFDNGGNDFGLCNRTLSRKYLVAVLPDSGSLFLYIRKSDGHIVCATCPGDGVGQDRSFINEIDLEQVLFDNPELKSMGIELQIGSDADCLMFVEDMNNAILNGPTLT